MRIPHHLPRCPKNLPKSSTAWPTWSYGAGSWREWPSPIRRDSFRQQPYSSTRIPSIDRIWNWTNDGRRAANGTEAEENITQWKWCDIVSGDKWVETPLYCDAVKYITHRHTTYQANVCVVWSVVHWDFGAKIHNKLLNADWCRFSLIKNDREQYTESRKKGWCHKF